MRFPQDAFKTLAKNTARVVMIVLVVLAFSGLFGRAIIEVSRGYAAAATIISTETPIHWVTVLTLATALAVAFLVGLGMRWRQRRDDRAIEKTLTGALKSNNRPRGTVSLLSPEAPAADA
jgi:hypothetical protein